ncbi:MAG TPA: 50S ribosomal protein L18 [Myxococcota bacterium]|nr:50S ribosomal protein L18 [Myxococcota bacterium]
MKRKIKNAQVKAWTARRARTRRKIEGSDRPRLTVYRSAKHIYAQIVEADTGRTILSVSSRSKQVMGDVAATGNVAAAKLVGKAVAAAALERKIDRVVFNRNGFLFHGRVKALAEAAREAGLQL